MKRWNFMWNWVYVMIFVLIVIVYLKEQVNVTCVCVCVPWTTKVNKDEKLVAHEKWKFYMIMNCLG